MRAPVAVRLAAVAVVLAASGCSVGTSGSGSRAEIYDSLEQLVSDSTAVVVATVVDQARDGEERVSRFEVEQTFEPTGIAATAPAPPTEVDPARILVVRQFDRVSPPLTTGERYLLFLNPTMLDGERADHFYVVGAVAGMYRAEGEVFHRTSAEDPELPRTVTLDQLD